MRCMMYAEDYAGFNEIVCKSVMYVRVTYSGGYAWYGIKGICIATLLYDVWFSMDHDLDIESIAKSEVY